ncbi:MAG: hypothetical protein NVSMB2_24970 [Chloroflexota bacterium]
MHSRHDEEFRQGVHRDDPVIAGGERVGHVSHVIVDRATDTVTEIVVARHGREYVVPFSQVESIRSEGVRLAGPWSHVAAENFERGDFRPVDHAPHDAVETGAPMRPVRHDATNADAERNARGRLELREEELHARTRDVEAGRVRIERESVPEHVTLEVAVRRDELVIERQPVDRRPTHEALGSQPPIDITLRKEAVEVEKQPVVYEEVRVGARPVQDTEHVTETVRRERLRVDKDPR